MSGNSVALDTSVAIAVLAGQAGSFLSQSVPEFLLPVPVIGELRYGALNSRRSTENLAEVEQQLRAEVAELAQLERQLRDSSAAAPGGLG